MYEDLQQHPGWEHFRGIMEAQRGRLLKALREGRTGGDGTDLTPAIRLCLTYVENLTAFPEAVKSRLAGFESRYKRKL